MNKVPLLQFRQSTEGALPFEVKRIETLPKSATLPKPHRHAFYVIFWVTAGSGTHYLDFSGDEIRPNSLHFVGPGQVHYWDIEAELEGFVIVFEPSLFLDHSDQRLLEQIDLFRAINCLSTISPPAETVAWFHSVIFRLEQEFSQEKFGRSPGIMAWLRLLLIECQRLVVGYEGMEGAVSAEKHLSNRYIALVEQNAARQHKVEWYADELAVTVAHLSKSVKGALGMTAGTLLRDRLVLEAKRLLVHTDETAAAISEQLNFEDASYFGRFFKRETDQTPRQFRTEFPTKYQKVSIK